MTGQRRNPGSRAWHWIAPLLLIAAGLAVWETVVRVRQVPSWLLPPPSAVAETLVVERALLFEHGIVTLSEVLLGFGLALIAGVLFAIAIDSSPALDRSLYPLLVASQTVPVPALAPLLLIWFGYGLLPKVLVTALIAFFPIVVNLVEGLRSTDPEVIAMLRTFGAGRWARFRLARLPSALPFLFAGARIGVAVAVIGAVFGELVGARAGLGYLLTRAMAQFQTERVVAAIFLLSLMGVGLFAIVAVSERLLLPWRRDVESE
ncbi:MAG: ABC transporter permease [Chloroflexota bacterium]|nr:ABC transporter permease [Chloroflexota bacterium]